VRRRLRPFVSRERREDLVVLKELIEVGKVTPVIDRTYPLSEAPAAIRYLEEGHAGGEGRDQGCEARPSASLRLVA
jgi:NADPH:quinone reductase-like Zn-dependent oxidoreductase